MVVVDPVAAATSQRRGEMEPQQLGQAAMAQLERLYQVDPAPSAATLEMMAAASGSPVHAVDRWFQQRRLQGERQVAVGEVDGVDESLGDSSEVGVEDLARVNRALLRDLSEWETHNSDPNPEPEPAPPPEPSPERLPPSPTPDFNGRWVLAETVGMEAFLTALGLGLIKRTVALKVAESLVGKAEQLVEQSGDKFFFTARGPNNPNGTPSRFVVGRADNVNENPLLGKVTTKLRWAVSVEQLDLGPPSGTTMLDAQMTTADGRQSSMRRWLSPKQGDRPEALYVQTTFEAASMTQRFDCIERPARKATPPEPPKRVARAAAQAAAAESVPLGIKPPPRPGQSEPETRAAKAEPPQIVKTRKRREPSPRLVARLAAVDNDHPVSQVALGALNDAERFLSDGWGEATVIADGAAKIWRRVSGSPDAKVVPVKTEGKVQGIDHISLRKLLVSSELKAAMGEASSASMCDLRMLKTVEIRANSTCATGTVWHHTSKFPWPLQDRDVCFVNAWTATLDPQTGKKRGRQIVVERSLQHEKAPISSSYTRMSLDLVFCLEADGKDTRMTVCANVDPGGDIPTRIVELAVSQMTDRLRNIAGTINTHRALVNGILRKQSIVDIDTSSTEEEDGPDAEDEKEKADVPADDHLPPHRLVTEDMLKLGSTKAFIVPEAASRPACAELGIEWSADHERLAASAAAGVVIELIHNDGLPRDAASDNGKQAARVHLRWMERREVSPPLEPFASAAVGAPSGSQSQGLGGKEVSIQVLRWEEGRNVNGFWTVDKFQHPNRHVRYVIQVSTKEKVFEVRRRWQHISDFNGELLKLSIGWLKPDDRWDIKTLPSSWSRPGFNAKKLEQRLGHLRDYFTRVAAWVTRLRTGEDKVIDVFAADLHPRMHGVRDFLIAGSLSVDTAARLLQSGDGGGSGRSRTGSMSVPDKEDMWATDQELEQPEDMDEKAEQDESPRSRGRERSVSLGGGQTPSVENAQPLSLSPASKSDDVEALGQQSRESTAGLTELILVVPLSCIALLTYPEPEPEPELDPLELTDSPMLDEGHLGRVAISLSDLSIVYHDAGVDMSVYDADDLAEQQKLQRLRSKTLEDLDTVNAAVKEARMVAAAMDTESPVSSPRSSLSHQPSSRQGSCSNSEPRGGSHSKPAEGWQGVTVYVGSIEISDGGSAYGSMHTTHVIYDLVFAVDGVDAFRIKKRYSELKEIHDAMVAGGCFGWNGAPEFAPMHMFSDMVTDPENVMLRGRELCEYFQRVVSDEGAMTHPITARHLTFDGEVVQELRLEREESAQAAEELRIREERRSEDGRSHCRLLSNFPSQTLFSHHMSVGMATHCLSRAAVASMRLAQHQQLQQRQHQQ